MDRERDAVEDLAEEIRAAVARAVPAADAGARAAAPAYPSTADLRVPLDRALAHITPSIPAGARLFGTKRLVLRALRFLWRNQAGFNALLVETAGGLADATEEARQRLERLEEGHLRTLRAFEERLESHRNRWETARQELVRRMDEWERAREEQSAVSRRREAIEDGRLAILERASAPLSAVPAASVPALPPGVYSLFEERFRGTPEEIAEKQRSYLPFLEGVPGPVLDVGSGRGEFLRLLGERGISASGVETNPIAAGQCRAAGLDVEEGDGLAALSGRPDASLGGVVALQVVEHWPPELVFCFLREARRALAPGGVLLVETINTDSLSSLRAFFLDPSHVRPVPPEALRFLAEAAGFADSRIEYKAPIAEEDRLKESSDNDAKLNRLLFGPQDYALIARVPAC